MNFYQVLLGLLLFPAVLTVYGQESGIDVDPVLVRVKGKVISAGDSAAVPVAHVVYTRNRTATSTNTGGFFSMVMLNVDSLFISAMGFKTKVVKLPRYFNESNTLTIFLEPVVYLIGEVQVTGEKNRPNMYGIPQGKPSDIPQELRGDAFNEKPPLLAAVLNPLSYWQYFLSNKEKEKRDVREAMALEKNWEMHSLNYNKEMVKKLTGLNNQQAEEFMIWFNAPNVLPYTSNEYEVRASIRAYFDLYKKQKNLE